MACKIQTIMQTSSFIAMKTKIQTIMQTSSFIAMKTKIQKDLIATRTRYIPLVSFTLSNKDIIIIVLSSEDLNSMIHIRINYIL